MFFTKKPLMLALALMFLACPCPSAFSESLTEKKQVNQGVSQHPQENLFAALNGSELDYYKQSFSYAMETVKPDQVYEWRTASSFGAIRLGKRFKSKTKTECRTFSETFEINGNAGALEGYGCKRDGREGWCKLREGNMLNCSMEPPDGIIDSVLNKANQASTNGAITIQRNENNFWNWWPF